MLVFCQEDDVNENMNVNVDCSEGTTIDNDIDGVAIDDGSSAKKRRQMRGINCFYDDSQFTAQFNWHSPLGRHTAINGQSELRLSTVNWRLL